jgi:hypothetical protein
MANADTTTDVLVRAGFEEISLHRCDIKIAIGADLDQAVEFVMALGPAGELIRLAGTQAERRRSNIVAALREAPTELQGPDGTGVRAPASTRVVGARPPGPAATRPPPECKLCPRPRANPLLGSALALRRSRIRTYERAVREHGDDVRLVVAPPGVRFDQCCVFPSRRRQAALASSRGGSDR